MQAHFMPSNSKTAPGGKTRQRGACGVIWQDMKKALARSCQGKKEPAHMGPAVSTPILHIPGASDHATPAGGYPRARNRPQSAQRGGVPGAACKRVTMVFSPFHLCSLHFITFSSIHSYSARAAQNRINGTRKYLINKIHIVFPSIGKGPGSRRGLCFIFDSFLLMRIGLKRANK